MILAGALAVLLDGCGGSSHKTVATTSSVATAAPGAAAPEPAIAHRLLTSSEMPPGFSAQGRPSVSSSIAQWVQQVASPSNSPQSETVRLKQIGFVAAATLNLISSQGAGISLVEQFRSPAGPRSELANILATVNGGPAGQVRFSVPGVPHSAGFGGSGSNNGVNVAFADGDYYYVVGEQPNAPANRAGAIASAQRLYHRVRG